MPRQSRIVKKKGCKPSPDQSQVHNTSAPPASSPENPPPPQPSPRWWQAPHLDLQVCGCGGDREGVPEAEHVQVIEKATDACEGTIAIIERRGRNHEEANKLANQIAKDPGLLDKLAGTEGVIDRRGSRPDPFAEDPLEDWDYVDRLMKLAEQNCEGGDPILEILRIAESEDDNDLENAPDVRELRKARQAFHAMPLPKQRKILNGWKPQSDQPTRRELMEEVMQAFIWPVLKLEEAWQGGIWAGHVFRLLHDHRNIHVEIAAGCTFTEAVQTLEAITNLVKARWKKLIALSDFMTFDGNLRGAMPGEDTHER